MMDLLGSRSSSLRRHLCDRLGTEVTPRNRCIGGTDGMQEACHCGDIHIGARPAHNNSVTLAVVMASPPLAIARQWSIDHLQHFGPAEAPELNDPVARLLHGQASCHS
jgi:hypothetical protein